MCTVTESNVPVTKWLKQIGWRIVAPVVKRLQTVMTCGLTPRKLSLTLCIGAALGIMPLLWGTTLICFIMAYLFRLNHVALQSVNYLFYPLQLALLAPFFRLGVWLFPWGPPLPQHLLATMIRNPLSSLNIIGWITFKSLAAWLVTVLPAVLLIYWVLIAVSGNKAVKQHNQDA
jgi:uncharacterized protein (DUF2062 family)